MTRDGRVGLYRDPAQSGKTLIIEQGGVRDYPAQSGESLIMSG